MFATLRERRKLRKRARAADLRARVTASEAMAEMLESNLAELRDRRAKLDRQEAEFPELKAERDRQLREAKRELDALEPRVAQVQAEFVRSNSEDEQTQAEPPADREP